jgi:hypothetical protein
MLINKPIELNDVVSIKMITGEEILAKLTNTSEKDITVSNPLILTQTPSGSIAAIPFIVTSDKTDGIEFSRNHIITMLPTSRTFADQYIKITTGIEPASVSSTQKFLI